MTSMKAVVLEAPGPPEALQIRGLTIPAPGPGQVLIKVAAFGLNRSELHTRLGLAHGVTFPRPVAWGEAVVPIHRVYPLEKIRQAHAEMEKGSAIGKIVVLTPQAKI